MTRPKNAEPTFPERLAPLHAALLADDERYQSLLAATDNTDAVEGSTWADDAIAAQKLRTRAKREGEDVVAGENLTAIAAGLNSLLRTTGQSRTQRANAAKLAKVARAKGKGKGGE